MPGYYSAACLHPPILPLKNALLTRQRAELPNILARLLAATMDTLQSSQFISGYHIPRPSARTVPSSTTRQDPSLHIHGPPNRLLPVSIKANRKRPWAVHTRQSIQRTSSKMHWLFFPVVWHIQADQRHICHSHCFRTFQTTTTRFGVQSIKAKRTVQIIALGHAQAPLGHGSLWFSNDSQAS